MRLRQAVFKYIVIVLHTLWGSAIGLEGGSWENTSNTIADEVVLVDGRVFSNQKATLFMIDWHIIEGQENLTILRFD